MIIIGIDPGMKGGVAAIPLYSFKDTKVWDMEKYSIAQLNGIFEEISLGSQHTDGDQEFWKDTPVAVFLEEPSLPYINTNSKDKDGEARQFNVQAHNKLSRSLGVLEGLVLARNWIPTLLSPRRWQYALGCQTGGDKKITLNLAQKIFPFLHERFGYRSMVVDNTADALLIALFGYLLYAQPKYLPKTVSENISEQSRTKIAKLCLGVHERYKAKPTPNYRTVLPVRMKGMNHERLANERLASERDGLDDSRHGSIKRSSSGPSKHRPTK